MRGYQLLQDLKERPLLCEYLSNLFLYYLRSFLELKLFRRLDSLYYLREYRDVLFVEYLSRLCLLALQQRKRSPYLSHHHVYKKQSEPFQQPSLVKNQLLGMPRSLLLQQRLKYFVKMYPRRKHGFLQECLSYGLLSLQDLLKESLFRPFFHFQSQGVFPLFRVEYSEQAFLRDLYQSFIVLRMLSFYFRLDQRNLFNVLRNLNFFYGFSQLTMLQSLQRPHLSHPRYHQKLLPLRFFRLMSFKSYFWHHPGLLMRSDFLQDLSSKFSRFLLVFPRKCDDGLDQEYLPPFPVHPYRFVQYLLYPYLYLHRPDHFLLKVWWSRQQMLLSLQGDLYSPPEMSEEMFYVLLRVSKRYPMVSSEVRFWRKFSLDLLYLPQPFQSFVLDYFVKFWYLFYFLRWYLLNYLHGSYLSWSRLLEMLVTSFFTQ